MAPKPRFAPPAYASLPTSCTIGDLASKTGSGAGLYYCSAANTWSQVGTGSGGGNISGTIVEGQVAYGDDPDIIAGNDDFTWDGTSVNFTANHGVSFAGGGSGPILLAAVNDGFGDTELQLSDVADNYFAVRFKQDVDLYWDGYAGFNGDLTFWNKILQTNGYSASAPGTVFNNNTLTYTNTGGVASDTTTVARMACGFGTGGVPAIGTLQVIASGVVIEGSGSQLNEFTPFQTTVRADIGSGYTQTGGVVGRLWGLDATTLSAVGVQSGTLNGIVQVVQNQYNGEPSASPSNGIAIVTAPGIGGGSDGIHQAAGTFPVASALSISGYSNNGSDAAGFTVAVDIGGASKTPWGESKSILGTGVKIRNCGTADIDSDGGTILLKNLPTSDPHVVGKVWNSSGTLHVSAG